MNSKLFKTTFAIIIFLIIILLSRHVLTLLYPIKYSYYVEKYCKQYNLDPNIIYAIIECESNFNESASSHAGAIGLMQITPETYEWAISKTGEKIQQENDLYDPETNIKYGCYIYSLFLNEFKDQQVALACYNAGRGNVKNWLKDSRYSKDGSTLKVIPFKETEQYVKKVNNANKIYQIIY